MAPLDEQQEDKIVIYQKKRYFILYILFSFIMAILCLYCVFIELKDLHIAFMIFLKTMMVICFGIFSFGFLYYTRKFIFKNITLVVDEKGITNNSSIISLGFIPWEDIQEIKFTNILNSKLILVKVYDEEKYLVGISKFKKLMININKKFGYPIHCITLNTTGSKPEEIYSQIKKIHELNKKKFILKFYQ